jgi:hypothetical protein
MTRTLIRGDHKWAVSVFVEQTSADEAEVTDAVYRLEHMKEIVTGFAKTARRGEIIRLEIACLPGGSGGFVELSHWLQPFERLPSATEMVERELEELELEEDDMVYPRLDFEKLARIRDDAVPEAWDGEQPTKWIDVPADDGIIKVPFTDCRLVSIRFKRRFSSKAQPYWAQFRDATGAVTDAIMKSGDDLRIDQVIINMLRVFNRIWKREGVTQLQLGGGRVPVRAPTYRCMTVGTKEGFVQVRHSLLCYYWNSHSLTENPLNFIPSRCCPIRHQ